MIATSVDIVSIAPVHEMIVVCRAAIICNLPVPVLIFVKPAGPAVKRI
jgi:hypothetical protein